MAYFGSIFFASMGGGGGQNYFQICDRILPKIRRSVFGTANRPNMNHCKNLVAADRPNGA